MPRRISWLLAFLFFIILVHPTLGSQTETIKPFSRLGIAITASSLGFGAEAASPISSRSNLRVGLNLFHWDRDFREDGVSYVGHLRFRSSGSQFDWFPFGGSFHVSPGVLVYNGNQLAANASVPAGQTLTLNHTKYASHANDFHNGTGEVDFIKAGPVFTVGWGNLIPRNPPLQRSVRVRIHLHRGSSDRSELARQRLQRRRTQLSTSRFVSGFRGKCAG